MTIDYTAKRYGCRPSELIESGNTIDLKCAEIALGYETWARNNAKKAKDHGYTQQQLIEQMEAAKRATSERARNTQKDG